MQFVTDQTTKRDQRTRAKTIAKSARMPETIDIVGMLFAMALLSLGLFLIAEEMTGRSVL
ncbi:hypothetical protein G6N76_21700 [Rhizobium daejeonense]|uniref:Uncharacterized protein n=1 Tax=Rhizobium daejeonense TaxID=240521 RepID=A0A6M1S7F3_9HYPH|nr:hypothetical protein [Rhizobium daejeonense]NGO66281.1 hypothetical protein [Rhizobium daejeonense]